MALRKACDVFGTIRNVEAYVVRICKADAEETLILQKTMDLGSRGLERLTKNIERGCTSPSTKNKENDHGDN